jgi:replicative DNA helicase
MVPLEIEREVLSAAFRAAMILEDDPEHELARRALDAIVAVPTDDFAIADHRIVHAAIVTVHGYARTVTPALVVQHLRKIGELDDRGSLIFGIVGYGIAPIVGIQTHLDIVRGAARKREEFVACRERQAEILDSPAR